MGDISPFLNFLSVLKFGNNKRGCEKKMDIHLIGISIFHSFTLTIFPFLFLEKNIYVGG